MRKSFNTNHNLMKTHLLSILLLVYMATVNGQELLTIGEVFDYEVGDKFHTSKEAIMLPPNADRITITGKYYSDGGDTVFYVNYHDCYNSEIIEWEPYLEYHFWTKTDTTFYTQLDSSISHYWPEYDTSMYLYDTIIRTSENHCDSLINGYRYETNEFEPRVHEKHYGKGLGFIYDYFFDAGCPPGTQWRWSLFYYQKNGIDCGTPDLTVSVSEIPIQPQIRIYPNPAGDFFSLDMEIQAAIQIFNLSGKQMDIKKINNKQFDCSNYPPGIYILQIRTDKGKHFRKLVKQ